MIVECDRRTFDHHAQGITVDGGHPGIQWLGSPAEQRCPPLRHLHRAVGEQPQLDSQWAFLVYAGLWQEPLLGDLNALMDSVNSQVTGVITLKLYKGSVRAVARRSPNSLYDPDLAGFGASGGLFSQQASPGFIELWSLQSRMAYGIRHRERGDS